MDPDTNNSATNSGLSRPDSDLGQLPPIHAPQSFHAPDAPTPHFPVAQAAAQDDQNPPPQPPAGAIVPIAPDPVSAQPQPTPQQRLAEMQATVPAAAPADDVDTAFDEEWVGKAREVVQRTQADPYVQSQELSKLKAQYIKARYNKDIKVGED